ncbi:hypothetical protein GEMRC1_011676 [Eukaryota sp. GEM-RC1]
MLVAFCGLDSTGKSTVVSHLNGHKIKLPDRRTDSGKIIDKFLKKEIQMSERDAQMLFAKNRKEKNDEIKIELLEREIVLMDRCWIDGVAYSPPESFYWALNQAEGELIPDLVFYFTEQYNRDDFGKEYYDKINVRKSFEKIFDLMNIEVIRVPRAPIKDVVFTIENLINERSNQLLQEYVRLQNIKRKIIGIDMDDTLCETTKQISKDYPEFKYETDPSKFHTNGIEVFSTKGFFKNLEPINRIVDITKKLIDDEFEVYFVTAAYHKMIDSGIREEKQEWLEQHFPELNIPNHLININNKQLLKLDLLIDDNDCYQSNYKFINSKDLESYEQVMNILFDCRFN